MPSVIVLASVALLVSLAAVAPAAHAGYIQTNLVANSLEYLDPAQVAAGRQILEPTLLNAWGISLRPAGLGGHFWVASNGGGVSLEYVGDVGGLPLFQDDLKVVTVPGPGRGPGTPTGTVFNGSGNFVVSQPHPNGPITGPARFLFVTDNGTLSAWTERRNSDGTFDRPGEALVTVDGSAAGVQYFGLAISPGEDRLYAANFGENPGMQIFDQSFADITASLAASALVQNPFAADGYQPFNVQTIGANVFVAYARFGTPGEEETGPGLGRLAEFDVDGNLLAVWEGGDYLNAPWGLALAPAGWGPCAGALLVSDFGDGTIACLDPETRTAYEFLRDGAGTPIAIEGIWGITFGNGASLGRADALYFAAGPREEEDGIFGRLTVPLPASAWLVLAGLAGVIVARRRDRAPR
ncbi:MAG: TIGR03118 family protein [Candidatus Rokubacteria bacterium]|nr:TIGR03118 family protein [Candidatus Rokubacteria bacterium]